jgi:hypothetical protein
MDEAPQDGTAILAFGIHDRDAPDGASPQARAGDYWWGIIQRDIWRAHPYAGVGIPWVFCKDGKYLWSEPLRWTELVVPPEFDPDKPRSSLRGHA